MLAVGAKPPKFMPASLKSPITAFAFLALFMDVESQSMPSWDTIIPKYAVDASLPIVVP
jgi:hypothetical protein